MKKIILLVATSLLLTACFQTEEETIPSTPVSPSVSEQTPPVENTPVSTSGATVIGKDAVTPVKELSVDVDTLPDTPLPPTPETPEASEEKDIPTAPENKEVETLENDIELMVDEIIKSVENEK